MQLRRMAQGIGLALLAMTVPCFAAEAASPTQIRQAVTRAVPMMLKSIAEYPHHNTCFSCHHQGVPMFALALAQSHGYAVGEKPLQAIVQHTTADLRADLPHYIKGEGQPGGVTRAGYAMLALESGGVKRDEITSAVIGFLIQKDKELGYWRAASNRPPAEASSFTNTFLGIHALKAFGAESQQTEITARIAGARQWLEQTPTKETEDRVFQLWGLKEAGADNALLHKLTQELASEQKADGGWAQLPGSNSDSYATGTALTVLLLAGGLPADDPVVQRGVRYLLQAQQPDGTWHVVTRSKPVQPYFESGFPYGRDQFISMAATAWATTALVLVGPPGDGPKATVVP